MPARAIGSGTISFGLVSIPVKLYTSASPQKVQFHLLHKKCGGRMKQQYLCATDNEVVPREEMVKGYEYARSQLVQFSDEELEQLESERTGSIDIVEFVPSDSVDLVEVEKSYYLGPDKGGDKAYQLLGEAMERRGHAAVGRWAARGKEQLVLVCPYRDGLILHQMFYANEVRAFSDVPMPDTDEIKEPELALAVRLIEQIAVAAFEPVKYKDAVRERIEAYLKFVEEMRAYLVEQQKAHPDCKGFFSDMEKIVQEFDGCVAARWEKIRTPSYVAELNEDFRKNGLDLEGPDAIAKCKKYTQALVEVGDNQDELVGECRWVAKTLRQKAGLLMATDPKVAPVAEEVRARTGKILRNSNAVERSEH
jgi:DNA end-binding protein Ku